jgi:hypothetical protein
MANKSQDFRRSHINHIGDALKAAVSAGVRDPMVHVRLPGGAELHVGSGAGGRPVAPVVPRPVAAAVIKPVKARAPAPPRGIRPSR